MQMRFIFILQKTKLIDFSAHLYLYPKRPHTNLFYFLLILFDIFFYKFWIYCQVYVFDDHFEKKSQVM